MIGKAGDNWADIEQYIKDLWPSTYKKHMTNALSRIWKRKLGHIRVDTVLSALDYLATESHFFPKAGEVWRRAKTIIEEDESQERRNEIVQRTANIEQEAEEIKSHWINIKQIIKGLKKSEREAHKQSIIQQGRLKHIQEIPSNSYLWSAEIYDRIIRKVEPNETDSKYDKQVELAQENGDTEWQF